jgi:hypothetical protein
MPDGLHHLRPAAGAVRPVGVKVSQGTAKVRLRTGGSPGVPDGTDVVATTTNSPAFAPIGVATGPLPVTAGLLVVKMTVQNDCPAANANIRAKTVTFSAGSAGD